MRTTTDFSLSPGAIPPVIKTLLLATAIGTIGSGLLEGIMIGLFGIPGPQTLLTLSSYSLSHYFIWTPLTHLFVHGAPGMGLSFGLLIELAFHCYLLWTMGTMVLERVGSKSFLRLYLVSGVLAGLTAAALISFTGHGYAAGSSAAVLAVLLVWVMLNPDATILLFFVMPVQARWLVAGIAGAILLVNLSHGDVVDLGYYLVAMATGYFYGVFAYGLYSPWVQTRHFESRLHYFAQSTRQRFHQWKTQNNAYSKIIDIKTGKARFDSDEAFLDAMLEKISRNGEGSLSWRERRRMRKISKRKNRRH